MVTVIGYAQRDGKDGKRFISLQLQGDIELVQSLQTGRFYATARKCSVTSTFDELSAKGLIGTKLRGSIRRAECDPYDYTVPETGEIMSLSHTYHYVPEEEESPQIISTKLIQEVV